MRALIFALAIAPGWALAQQIDTPLQDERLNLAACLMAIDPLPATYRSHLARSCVAVPLKICELRGTPDPCLQGTNEMIRAFYANNRPKLPKVLDAAPLKAKAYARGLVRADAMVAATYDQPAEAYPNLADALVQLFYRARQAGVEVSK